MYGMYELAGVTKVLDKRDGKIRRVAIIGMGGGKAMSTDEKYKYKKITLDDLKYLEAVEYSK